MLRQLFLRSRERATALKRDNYSCQKCGVKSSKAKDKVVKVEVHHVKGISMWDEIIDLINKELLCDPDELQTLCVPCHQKETYSKK